MRIQQGLRPITIRSMVVSHAHMVSYPPVSLPKAGLTACLYLWGGMAPPQGLRHIMITIRSRTLEGTANLRNVWASDEERKRHALQAGS